MRQCVLLIFAYTVYADGIIQRTLHDGNTQFTARMFSVSRDMQLPKVFVAQECYKPMLNFELSCMGKTVNTDTPTNEVVNENPGKSVILSAFSVITPLSQLAAASEGPSHDELLNAVGFSDDSTANDVFALIDAKFNSIQGVQLKKASKLYVRVGDQVQEEFSTLSKNVYHTEIENVDFNNNKNATNEINTWVEKQTNHRIKDLVDSGSITPGTRAVLVNALYFKGSWKYPFNNAETIPQHFYVNEQKSVQILMMHNTEDYKYKESERLKSKILELPYDGDQSSFVVVLPNSKEGIQQLKEDLKDTDILEEEMNAMLNVEVRVSIPKFKIETMTDLKKVLIKMNVTKVFGNQANITKLLKSDEALYITDAVQKAFIEINEEGAEAAAANAFLIVESAIIDEQSFDFIADHPFVFFLKAHDEIIFNGVYYGS